MLILASRSRCKALRYSTGKDALSGVPACFDAAEKNRVPYMVISGPTGGHGFGLGSATSQKGWVERMLEFYHNFC